MKTKQRKATEQSKQNAEPKERRPMFKLTRKTLSQACRRNILLLFADKNMTKVDVSALAAEVDELLAAMTVNQKSDRNKRIAAKRVKQSIRDLLSVLQTGLAPGTKQILQRAYQLAYPMPPPYEGIGGPEGKKTLARKVLNQASKTHFIRMDERGRMGLPVPITEIMDRLIKACQLSEKLYRPRPGAPTDYSKINFTMWMLSIFERQTGTTATATPTGTFGKFLSHVLTDISNESDSGPSHSKLIKAAMAERERLPADDRELLRWSEALEKRFGKERAHRFLLTHVLPVEAEELERLLPHK